MKANSLLTIDAAINLLLGIPLMVVPTQIAQLLGFPIPEPAVYASILGAVLTGIGVALLIERYRDTIHMAGLGIGGAIAINIIGAVVLILWLLLGNLDMPVRGYIFLWAVAIVVMGISLVELPVRYRKE
ncbi:MAG: hypothetical protein JSW54_03750 [Fidelibacterota bacterium]|nr:MAG: hypothetical protein JSW54_03750 [Candidatus Neomarinimicrobiota bacterium]